MSSPPEVIVRAVEAFNRRDLQTLRATARDDVIWEEDQRFPGAETFHGHEGIEQGFAKWFDAWAELRSETTDLRGAGDTWVLTSRVLARGKGSEVEVEGTSYAVYELRDGLVARLRLYGDRDQAFAAAGLPLPPGQES